MLPRLIVAGAPWQGPALSHFRGALFSGFRGLCFAPGLDVIQGNRKEISWSDAQVVRPGTSLARSMAALAIKLLRLRFSSSAAFSISFRSFGCSTRTTWLLRGLCRCAVKGCNPFWTPFAMVALHQTTLPTESPWSHANRKSQTLPRGLSQRRDR